MSACYFNQNAKCPLNWQVLGAEKKRKKEWKIKKNQRVKLKTIAKAEQHNHADGAKE